MIGTVADEPGEEELHPLPIVRMLPGAYEGGLVFDQSTVTPLEVVATGATVLGFTAIQVKGGASLKLRGPELVGQNFSIDCGQSDEPSSRLELAQATLKAASASSSGLLGGANCSMEVSETIFQPGAEGNSISLATDASLRADRVHIVSTTRNGISVLFKHVSLLITNSVLENPEFFFLTNDTGTPGSSVRLAYNTMVFTAPGNSVLCQPVSNLARTFENNVLFSSAAGQISIADGSACSFTSNVIFPQQPSIQDNIIADPLFVDFAGGDFRVTADSPAVGSADPEASISTDHDFLGAGRHAANSPGSQVTAMHSFGVPPKTPSTSQKGKAWSVHNPSAHDRGLGFVQAQTAKRTTAINHMGGSISPVFPRLRRFPATRNWLADQRPCRVS